MANDEKSELVYFNLDGRAMQIRLLFHLSGTPFTDTRLGRAEWPDVKKETPWGFLPILRCGGRTYFDSVAIAVHVAREVGLWPDEIGEQTRSLAIMNAVEDTWCRLQRVSGARNPLAKLWRIRRIIRHDLPELCAKFERQIEGDFFLGDEVSAVDLSVFSLLYVLRDKAGRYGATEVLSSFKGLDAFYERVTALQAVSAYIKG